MKKLVEEVSGEGLESLLGEKVTLFCANYFYTGTLTGVNETCVLLENPSIVYDTGDWSNKSWTDCQSMNIDQLYIMTSAIESFGVVK